MRTVYLLLTGILFFAGFSTTTLSAQRNCGAMEHLEMQMQQINNILHIAGTQ